VENIALRPSTLALKLSTKRSSSSVSVDAPGSSTWIQRAPSVIRACRLGRIRLRATFRRRLKQVLRRPVPLVEGPVRDGVGAGHRNLELGLCHRRQVRELGVVEGRAQGDRADDRLFAVVLVVEGAHAAAAFEAVGVADRPVVHLGALLLAVVDDVEAGALLEADGVEAGPALQLGLLLFAEGRVAQQVE
jgi:hypothetical protein